MKKNLVAFVTFVTGQRTLGGVSRPWSLAWTCGRVRWSTTARLERERERDLMLLLGDRNGIQREESAETISTGSDLGTQLNLL